MLQEYVEALLLNIILIVFIACYSVVIQRCFFLLHTHYLTISLFIYPLPPIFHST